MIIYHFVCVFLIYDVYRSRFVCHITDIEEFGEQLAKTMDFQEKCKSVLIYCVVWQIQTLSTLNTAMALLALQICMMFFLTMWDVLRD